MNIIFVCTGNTCRSPMAEGYFKYLCKTEQRDDIVIQSAGINTVKCMPPSIDSVKIMSHFGINIQSHNSQSLSNTLINWADIIIVMSQIHKHAISLLFYESNPSKIFLLNQFDNVDHDIDDPYGGSTDIYHKCFQSMKKPLDNLFKEIDNLLFK